MNFKTKGLWSKVTPLKSYTTLRSKSLLKSRTKLSPTGGIKKQSAGNKDRQERYLSLRDEYLRLHPNCEICNNPEVELHHKGGRRGENLFRFFMSVCRICHRLIHDNPEISKQNGWLN